MPAARQRSRSPASALAVSATMGTRAAGPCLAAAQLGGRARSRPSPASGNPSAPGRTGARGAGFAAPRARCPASCTRQPSASSMRCATAWLTSLSSTSSTRARCVRRLAAARAGATARGAGAGLDRLHQAASADRAGARASAATRRCRRARRRSASGVEPTPVSRNRRGRAAWGSRARTAWASASPSMPGMCRSISIRSIGTLVRQRCGPAQPPRRRRCRPAGRAR